MGLDIKLFKRPNSPYYQMYWYGNGKIHRVSTKTGNRRKALKVLREKEREILAQEGLEDYDTLTLKNLLEEVEFSYRSNNLKSAKTLAYRKKPLVEYFGEDQKVLDITEVSIDKYIKHRLSQKSHTGNNISPSTINKELALLKRGFNLLIDKKLIRTKPTIKMMAEHNVRTGFLEYEDYLKLLEVLPKYLVPVFKFAYKSGWRRSEILNLKWDMVNLEDGLISIPPGMTKNNKGRMFYLDDELKQMFNSTRVYQRWTLQIEEAEWVFVGPNGRIKDFRYAWKKACKNAGVKYHFHDLRRTAARNLIRAGVSQRVAQEITGHLTASVFDRYNIVSDTDLKDAVLKQQNYLNQQKEKVEQREEDAKKLVILKVD